MGFDSEWSGNGRNDATIEYNTTDNTFHYTKTGEPGYVNSITSVSVYDIDSANYTDITRQLSELK